MSNTTNGLDSLNQNSVFSKSAYSDRTKLFHIIGQSNLVLEMQKCTDTINNPEATIDNKYNALKFISESESLYDFLGESGLIRNSNNQSWEIYWLLGSNICLDDAMYYICNKFFPTKANTPPFNSYNKKTTVEQMERLITFLVNNNEESIAMLLSTFNDEPNLHPALNGVKNQHIYMCKLKDVIESSLFNVLKKEKNMDKNEVTANNYINCYKEIVVERHITSFVDNGFYE